jgi:hypothetical protein
MAMSSRVRQLAACGVAGFLLFLLTLNYGHSTQGRIVNRHSVYSQPAKRADPDLCMFACSDNLTRTTC